MTDATSSENGLDANYYQYLLKGGTGLTSKTPDTRITDVNSLPPGPFQLTSSTFPYYGYAASPVHRFYQMWQQFDCLAKMDPVESKRLSRRPVPVGRGDGWSGHQRQAAGGELQHRMVANRNDHRRRLNLDGLLQHAKG